MDALSLRQIAEFAGAKILCGNAETMIERVSTDSRRIKPGELFVALHGEHFDAHNFLEDVAKAGAAGAIVSQNPPPDLPENLAILRATDSLVAYQNLCASYRKTLPLKVLGITGSNGKTSTKDFAASILGRGFPVTKTAGNFNNHVGLPRTMLEATRDDESAVWAVAAGRAFRVSLEECAAGLVAAPLCKARLQIREINGVQFIDDSYNANPDSMKAALRTLMELDADGKRVAVLGRMLELGAESERGHREVGETAATLGIDYLISIAEDTIAVAAEKAGLENFAVAKDASEAAEMLGAIVGPGDLVLIKGSRSSRKELVLDEFAKLQPVGGDGRG